jgi:hypothetical protein
VPKPVDEVGVAEFKAPTRPLDESWEAGGAQTGAGTVVALDSVQLPTDQHKDPADRLIVATARRAARC